MIVFYHTLTKETILLPYLYEVHSIKITQLRLYKHNSLLQRAAIIHEDSLRL